MDQKGDTGYNDGANDKDSGKNKTIKGGDAAQGKSGAGGDAGYNDGANTANTNNGVQPGQNPRR